MNKTNELPATVRARCISAVRDYDRMRQELCNILYSSPQHDGQPKGNSVTDQTGSKAIRMAELGEQCKAIEQAIITIPDFYRQGILNQINYPEIRYDTSYASAQTWSHWKHEFLFQIAINMKYITILK